MKNCFKNVLFFNFLILAITCPKLKVPENGYLVKANACNNVVNAACGLRCKIGFRLVGDSIQLCRINGTWSGTETQCLCKFNFLIFICKC